jgi:hypothetical protein
MNNELLYWAEEAYENYLQEWNSNCEDENFKSENGEISMMHDDDPYPIYVPYSEEEFIWQVKFEDTFAKRWGVSVNRRELTFEERCEIQIDKLDGMYSSEKNIFIHHSIDEVKRITMDKNKIPKKVISLTYNNKTIEIYE